MRKIDWGNTIFLAIFDAIGLGLLCKSYLMAVVFFVWTLIGGITFGLIFGEPKQ